MVYIVILIDNEYGKKFAIGYSKDYNVAEKYKDSRNRIAEKNHNKMRKDELPIYYDIIFMSDQKYEEFRTKITTLYACGEISEVPCQPGTYISEDDFEFLESALGEFNSEFFYHCKYVKNFLSLFKHKDKDVQKFLKLLKVLKERYDMLNNDDNEVMKNLDYEKALAKSI